MGFLLYAPDKKGPVEYLGNTIYYNEKSGTAVIRTDAEVWTRIAHHYRIPLKDK